MLKRLFTTAMLLCSLYVATAQQGTWSGKIDIQGSKLTIVFHLDGDKPTMDSPDQGAKGIPISVAYPDSGKVEISIPSLGASYKGMWLINNIVGTFTQMNVDFPLTLTPGENRPKRPQTPVPPFPYLTEEVSFSSGDFTLNGTLTTPEGATHKTLALVMVTGSGQQNRDEELFDHKPFAVIADALARAGIATLRYDDRGFGNKSINSLNYTTTDFKDDALAAVALLRTRFENVGIIGHSEGGTIALMAAAEQKVDFAISLAGMVVSGAETLIMQNRAILTEARLDKEGVDSYCKLLEATFNATINGNRVPNPTDFGTPQALYQSYWGVVSMLETPYMAHFISLDMRPRLKSIVCPILALNGTKDIQVEYQSNLSALRSGLTTNQNNTIEAVEGLNHLFQHCTTGAVTEYNTIEQTFAPEVLEMIINWLNSL